MEYFVQMRKDNAKIIKDLNSLGAMVPPVGPILAWSKVASPLAASFWTQKAIQVPFESSAFPLSQSGRILI